MGAFLTKERVLPLAIVFGVLFLTAEFAQYIYFSAHTSPALIWPPAGIALAVVVLYGYGMWPAIALAAFVVSVSLHSPAATVIGSVLANTTQALVGAYVLQKIGFDPRMRRVRDTIAILVAAFFVTMVGPTIAVSVQALFHTLSAPAALVWTRTWGGWMLSVLIMTPLISTWLSGEHPFITREELPELSVIFASLLATSYFLFWTYSPTITVWVALLFLIPFLWLALRSNPRLLSLGLFLTNVMAVAGTLLAHPHPAVAMSQQLLSDEVFMSLIAGIFLVIVSVVTERRTANIESERYVEQLKNALSKISEEDKTKNEFIAILAHELRNPLAPIVSTLELLQLQKHDPATLEMLEDIEAHTSTMGRLLDDLLDISRVSQKTFELKKEPAQLSVLLKRAIETTRFLIDRRGHELKIIVPKNPLWINVDPVRFEQIVVNLLSNATKYTAPGGRIELTAVREDSTLVIIVRDNGCGISADNLPTIFEPFRRKSISRRSGGLGIGLSITKQLVEMHGGTITAASDGAEQGSTFIVRMPIPSSIELPVSPQNRTHRKAVKGPAFKILVVDDNDAAAQGLSKLLQHKGHEVALAYNGKDALYAALSFKPEVVLLDIGLPDMDGYRVARQLRKKQESPLTLIAVSGYGQTDDKKKSSGAGFNHHLVKPVGIADIEHLLRNIPATQA